MHTTLRILPFAVILLLAAAPARADDVTVKPPPGGGLVVTNSAGTSERLRVNENGGVFLPGLQSHPSADRAICSNQATGVVGTCALAAGPAGPVGPPGLVWRGDWDSGTAYAIDDGVSFGGASYIATVASTAQQPDLVPANWSLLAQKGTTGATGPDGGSLGPIVCAKNEVEIWNLSGLGPQDFILEATCPPGYQRMAFVSCTRPNNWTTLFATIHRDPHDPQKLGCRYTGSIQPLSIENLSVRITCHPARECYRD